MSNFVYRLKSRVRRLFLVQAMGLGASAFSFNQDNPISQDNAPNKSQTFLSVFDWMSGAEIADVQSAAPLLDLSQSIQKAVDSISTSGSPNYGKTLLFPKGTYSFEKQVNVTGSWFSIYGDGAVFRNTSPTHPLISTSIPADKTIPTDRAPGPMRGCAFYFTTLIYNTKIERITFSDFRFALAFLIAHNSPTFNHLTFSNCNAGVICYQGSQNYTYNSPVTFGRRMGPLHISSSTCFPIGSEYAGRDNFFTDGLTILNETGSIAGGILNPAFDQWFIDSILRPSTPSVSITGTYSYPFQIADDACTPSGYGLAFVAMRNQRVIYGPKMVNLDFRGGNNKGAALFNGAVSNFMLESYRDEGTCAYARQHFLIGAFINGLITDYAWIQGNKEIPFIQYTGKGASTGFAESSDRFVIFQNYLPFITNGSPITPGISRAICSSSVFVEESTFNGFSNANTKGNGPLRAPLAIRNRGRWTSTNGAKESWNSSFTLPHFQFGTAKWQSAIQFESDGSDVSGIITLTAVNTETGETDYAKYYVQTGAPYNLITATQIGEGDLFVQVTAAPPRAFGKYTQFSLGGISLIADRYDATKNVIELIAPITGLGRFISQGAVLTKAPFLSVLMKPQRGFFDLRLGGMADHDPHLLTLSSLIARSEQTIAGSSQLIHCSFSHTALSALKYSSGHPKTGHWAKGAIVYEDNVVPGGYIGYVCVQSGAPGIWKGFGLIAAD